MKVAVFFGTRPEAIKMAPVVRALEASDAFDPLVVSTGQHREMLKQVVDLFGIDVDIDLDVMRPDQSLAGLTARVIERVDATLAEHEIDLALVQGDTTTVLSAALACFYRRIPVGHVEAGLRTGDLTAPFPEEANRVLAGRIVDFHFAPTERSRDNLLREAVPGDRIWITGNTVIDALLIEAEAQESAGVRGTLDAKLGPLVGSASEPAKWREREMVLVTGHRRENFGDGFREICHALRTLAERFPETAFIYPVHLNPNVQGPVHEALAGFENVKLIAPQPYREFVSLMKASSVILTDSGGVQEEAPSLGKPVLVMRETTERPEGVDAGTVRLVGASADRIIDSVSELLTDREAYQAMANATNPYGDGHAAGRIVEVLEKTFVGRPVASH